MELLDAEVERICMNTMTSGTRRQYEGSIAKMLAWFAENATTLLHPNYLTEGSTSGYGVELLRKWTAAKPYVAPLDLDRLQALDFQRYVVSMSRANGESYSKSTFDTVRSGLVYLHTLSGRQLPAEFGRTLKQFYKGLGRTATRESQDTNERLATGKEPLQFWLYRRLCSRFLQVGIKDGVFAHAFLVITWNLACRANSAASIRFAHVVWREDSLAVLFAHMKNDQEGERPRDPRHIYAYPACPDVCPVLAVGI